MKLIKKRTVGNFPLIRFFSFGQSILPIFLFLTFSTCFGQLEISYPHWFLYPAADSKTSVGYVYDTSVSAPLDSEKRYWGQKKVRVFGVRKFYSSKAVIDFQDSIMLEPLHGDRKPLNILAVYILDGDSLVLSGEDQVNITGSILQAEKVPKPQWVSTLPSKKSFVYGVGESRLNRRYHHRSWSRTDENAIVSCAKSVKLKIGNLMRNTENENKSHSENVVSENVDVILKDVQILERWLDYEAMTCFSLARARVD